MPRQYLLFHIVMCSLNIDVVGKKRFAVSPSTDSQAWTRLQETGSSTLTAKYQDEIPGPSVITAAVCYFSASLYKIK